MTRQSREFPSISDWWNFTSSPSMDDWFEGEMSRARHEVASANGAHAHDWTPAETDGTDSALEPRFGEQT